MSEEKNFPEGMVPLDSGAFRFLCHPDVKCFTVCCRQVDLDLYPYDIVRLKGSLGVESETFLRTYTELKQGGNPYFPTVKLKLASQGEEMVCPFLTAEGCKVYKDRPTACRTYPLERAVDRTIDRGKVRDFYFLTNHPYCLGHQEEHFFSVKDWVRNQRLDEFNVMNDLWAEVDTLFAGNPWKGEGSGGPKQQLAFMTCYNIDSFRMFVQKEELLEHFRIDRAWKRRIAGQDIELLKFGFEWIKAVLGGKTSLVRR